MGCLSKTTIIKPQIRMEKVFVPERAEGDAEAYVIVKELSAGEKDKFSMSLVKEVGGKMVRDLSNYSGKLASITLADDNGARLFGDSAEDLQFVSDLPAATIAKIVKVAQKLNGMDDDSVEKLEKNSDSGQSGT